jgi:cytochrome c oxidase assembly factor CtaG
MRPYAFDPHVATWLVLAVGVVAVVLGHRRLERTAERPIPWPRRQVLQFAGAVVLCGVALSWPLADLAAHWSLTTLVLQRMILLLAVAPLLLLGLPYDVLMWLTRPVAVDTLLLRLQRPPVAIITVTVVVVGSMAPPLVAAQASSPLARGALDLAIIMAGLILWIPVLGRIPGILRLKPVVRFGYLVGQAVIPAFLSFIYIFSIHPLYHQFSRSKFAINLRPLVDQQIAGFVSKLSMLFVLLSVGGVVLARAPMTEEEFGKGDPLLWADVERQFERADRKARADKTGTAPAAGVAPGEHEAVPDPHDVAAPSPPGRRPGPPTGFRRGWPGRWIRVWRRCRPLNPTIPSAEPTAGHRTDP